VKLAPIPEYIDLSGLNAAQASSTRAPPFRYWWLLSAGLADICRAEGGVGVEKSPYQDVVPSGESSDTRRKLPDYENQDP
jgi:hypothetical protein